ncbi:MAG TPA: tetratricopeptide repeat protein [Pirellulales bacterium]|nr:tetratricopeptide repeat protein [Pirellulales bacterium]
MGFALGWTFFVCEHASAQADVLNELYGSGVHAYNAGQYRDAYDDLTMAMRSGSQDPRAYYYRGLAYLKLGRPQEAQGDFKKAASLEMADTDHFYPVSKSLERVQGSARTQIERYRSQARLVAFQTRERRRFERYERIRKNEPNVLMPQEATEMPKEPAEEPDAEQPAPAPAEKEPAEDMPAEDMPADEAAEKSDDPFAEKGAAEGDDEMPADEAAEKDEEMPADEKSEGDESADEKKADDDPFAE